MGKYRYSFLPIGINIEGRRIVIAGGGNVALHKASIRSAYTENVTVVSPEFRTGFEELGFTLVPSELRPEHLEGAWLLYACTGDSAVNRQIRALAHERGILVSVCDSPSECDFISPAVFRDGCMTVAVGSDSRDVRRSIRVRDRVRELAGQGLFGADLGIGKEGREGK